MSKPLIIRWLAVCLIPLATLAVFAVNPPEDAAQHLINGIILACEEPHRPNLQPSDLPLKYRK